MHTAEGEPRPVEVEGAYEDVRRRVDAVLEDRQGDLVVVKGAGRLSLELDIQYLVRTEWLVLIIQW